MMRKLGLLLMMSLLVCFTSVNIDAKADDVKKIRFNENNNTYILENITEEELMRVMDNDGNYEKTGRDRVIDMKNGATRRISEYRLKISIPGVNNDIINVYYYCVMNTTSVTYNGKSYVQFVSFDYKPTYYLDSGNYDFDIGTGELQYTILNGGATIQLKQVIQLRTQVSVNTSLGPDWMAISTGSNMFYRSHAKLYTTRYNLPLYNVMI